MLTHKKLILAALVILMTITATACVGLRKPAVSDPAAPGVSDTLAGESGSPAAAPTASPETGLVELNTVGPYRPNAEETMMIRLLFSESSVELFDFRVSDEYTSVKVWYEEYRNGVLQRTGARASHDIQAYDEASGKIAVIFEPSFIRISLLTSAGGSAVTEYPDASQDPIGTGEYTTERSGMKKAVEIEDQKAIPLLAIAQNGEDKILHPPERLFDSPENINRHDVLYIFYCSFSK